MEIDADVGIGIVELLMEEGEGVEASEIRRGGFSNPFSL